MDKQGEFERIEGFYKILLDLLMNNSAEETRRIYKELVSRGESIEDY